MQTSPNGRKLIEGHEELRLKAYQDSKGVWTIGYGHIAGVKEGDTCTQEQADAWFAEDLKTSEHAIYDYVQYPVNQNEFDALVSLIFNIGVAAFKSSTVCHLLDEGDPQGAANAFLMWTKSGGKFVQGLLNRRNAERALFLTPETT
jgi:lysozyme